MPLTKCLRCANLFNKLESPICTKCMPDEENDFEKIREYVNEHPDNNAEIVSEVTGVDLKCVLRMIDQGNISTLSVDSIGSEIKCGQCGAPAISASKKLCQACLEKLNQKMLSTRKSIEMASKKKTQVGEFSSVRSSLDEKRK